MNNEKLILFAEDSVQDRSDITRSFKESETCTQLRFVEDGEDLMNYLCKRKGYTSGNAPSPDLIVLDINTPDRNSGKALEEIKKDPTLKQKTIRMLTKEPSYSDIEASSDLGAMISKTKPWSNDENRYIEFFQNVLALAQTE
jgi:two-component system response regulator